DLVRACPHQIGGFAQDLAALVGGYLAPGLEALVGSGQRLVEVAPRGMRQLADPFAGCGVHHLLAFGPGGLDPVAVNVVLKGRVHVRLPLGFGIAGVGRTNDSWGLSRKRIRCPRAPREPAPTGERAGASTPAASRKIKFAIATDPCGPIMAGPRT